uniref:Uncharacterized protein n=1 Tax=Cacopsylla melanoneura TaxID=428564 RepID=A0A8D8ZFZ7_9HEMI
MSPLFSLTVLVVDSSFIVSLFSSVVFTCSSSCVVGLFTEDSFPVLCPVDSSIGSKLSSRLSDPSSFIRGPMTPPNVSVEGDLSSSEFGSRVFPTGRDAICFSWERVTVKRICNR